jgi:integrase/recombinase XerC
VNPAASVRGSSHSVKCGKTPVLDRSEVRALLDSIDVTTPAGLRDRVLIGLMVYSFARIGAALAMKVQDVYVQSRGLWVRLREKGGKRREMPCHHNLETYLHVYVDGCQLESDPKGPLFRTIGRGTGKLTTTFMAPGQRLRHDPPARGRSRHRDEDRQPHVPRFRGSRPI